MERSANDSSGDLLSAYRRYYFLESGKIVRDISLVWKKLIDWQTIEEAESIIPFKYAEPKRGYKLPVGYRIWSLSRQKGQRYYAGNFFDLIVAETAKRTRRQKCKLSAEAIKFFEAFNDTEIQ